MFPVILAHGSLGAFDEVFFIGIAALFIVMMGISFVRSRNAQPADEEPTTPATPENAEASGTFKLE
jgi:hypothetical protein